MAKPSPDIRPSDLPTKQVIAPDGSLYPMKVVQSESPTLPYDILAAFRWNVKRIRSEQEMVRRGENDPA
jgi:hypothetical protein